MGLIFVFLGIQVGEHAVIGRWTLRGGCFITPELFLSKMDAGANVFLIVVCGILGLFTVQVALKVGILFLLSHKLLVIFVKMLVLEVSIFVIL